MCSEWNLNDNGHSIYLCVFLRTDVWALEGGVIVCLWWQWSLCSCYSHLWEVYESCGNIWLMWLCWQYFMQEIFLNFWNLWFVTFVIFFGYKLIEVISCGRINECQRFIWRHKVLFLINPVFHRGLGYDLCSWLTFYNCLPWVSAIKKKSIIELLLLITVWKYEV